MILTPLAIKMQSVMLWSICLILIVKKKVQD